jgi:hypothetical protein
VLVEEQAQWRSLVFVGPAPAAYDEAPFGDVLPAPPSARLLSDLASGGERPLNHCACRSVDQVARQGAERVTVSPVETARHEGLR